ncbi:hypothetical protein WJX81_005944 [Elliptochloris bilobata]|uniref:Uncharacterized protein n=1 Tax=Elliptochloris bilobata TaxID=381761 RepID=A0AAW1R1P5_9CHLO
MPRSQAEAEKGKGPQAQSKKAEKPPYKPPSKANEVFDPALDDEKANRDKRGRLVFEGQPIFRPTLTPRQVIRAGSFGGIYFNPKGGRRGIWGDSVDIDHKEFPADWFADLPEKMYLARRYDIETNKYGVKAGQPQAAWEEKGWIKRELDPRGWFHWYCRFYMGRRTEDDDRQIGRWKGVAGEKGRWKRALVKQCVTKNKRWDDKSVSPVIRQSLLHWAYELTEADFKIISQNL